VEQRGFEPSTPESEIPREIGVLFRDAKANLCLERILRQRFGQTDLADRGSLLLCIDSRGRPMQSDQTGVFRQSPVGLAVSPKPKNSLWRLPCDTRPG
jgi:hypothetical protein